jgi:hypothetical protein
MANDKKKKTKSKKFTQPFGMFDIPKTGRSGKKSSGVGVAGCSGKKKSR